MNITTRKCDACGTRHDSDDPKHDEYAQLVQVNGNRDDICPDCVTRLYTLKAQPAA